MKALARVVSDEGLCDDDCIQLSSGIVGSFLAAFIITFHPNTVFESGRAHNNELFLSAQRLLLIFEEICCSVPSQSAEPAYNMSRELLRSYAEALFVYSRRFMDWKTQDVIRLRGRILHSLEAIGDAIRQLPANKPVQRMQLMAQARTLHDRLSRIAGADALASFDATNSELVAEMNRFGDYGP